MAEVVFFIAAIGAVGGAAGTVALRDPFYSVLALVAHLLCLAALFLLLRAEFVAAAQVVVYAGAVMVLYVFVSAYIGRRDPSTGTDLGPSLKGLSFAFAAALFVELVIAMLGSGLAALDTEGRSILDVEREFEGGFGSPGEVGRLLLTDYLLAFEVASFLLLVAAVGSVILARRREGLEPAGTISVGDLFSTTERTGTIDEHGQGTMLESGGSPKR